MKKNVFIFIFLFLISQAKADSSWELSLNKEGIQVYTRTLDKAVSKEYRAVMYLKDVKLNSLVSLLNDTSSYTQWMHNVIEAKILKLVSYKERYTYTIIDAPWPVSDRDTIVHGLISQDPQNHTVRIDLKGQEDFLPKQEGCVRVLQLRGHWLFKPMPNGVVMIVYQMYDEPGGSLPDWLANASVTDLPFETFRKMKKILSTNKYANVHFPDLKEPN